MKTRKVWANLSVDDVERTYEFYQSIGFRPNGEFPNKYKLASFLVGEDDFVVHFFSKESENFKSSMGGKIADLKQGNEVLFTLSGDSKEDVDEWAKVVKKAGGTIFSKPQKIQENWYGCGFADPDGHKWNVFYM